MFNICFQVSILKQRPSKTRSDEDAQCQLSNPDLNQYKPLLQLSVTILVIRAANMVKDYPVTQPLDEHQHRPDVYQGPGACLWLYQVDTSLQNPRSRMIETQYKVPDFAC